MSKPIVIKRIIIKKLFDGINIDWTLNNDVSVLVGDNGAGKTTILKLIRDVTMGTDFIPRKLYYGVKIETSNGTYALRDPHRTVDEMVAAKKVLKELSGARSSEVSESAANELSKLDELSLILEKMVNSMSRLKKEVELSDSGVKSLTEYELMSKMDKELIESLRVNPRMKISSISTVDLLANLSREFKDNTGIKINYFNEEIRKIYSSWFSRASTQDKKQLEIVFNDFFNDISKRVVLEELGIRFYTENNRSLGVEELSSGERQITDILLRVALAKLLKHDLILMDEPEISLHLSWQKKLLSAVRKINNYSQIIVVTHSPALVLKGWRDSYVDIKEIGESDDSYRL